MDESAPQAGSSVSLPTTVSALTSHIVALVERDALLRDVWVTGEVSNWKQAASGHVYFSMKDGSATMSAVMWRSAAGAQNWLPTHGDQIVAHGYVGVYPERGGYQLYVNRIRPAGRGQLYAQFERLKEQLAAAGLFDAERKRLIPAKPRRIGVVTSADAAALRDILRVISQRWPLLEVVIFPTLVQGSEAPKQIVTALNLANEYSAQHETLDAILLARGGGSIEDLWSFNDQRVAYAMVESELPIVTGVGHETDFTIADFVADLRTPTPSAAAMALTPNQADMRDWLMAVRHTLTYHLSTRVEQRAERHYQHAQRLQRVHPQRQLDQRRQWLEDRSTRIHQRMGNRLGNAQERSNSIGLRLDALNPNKVLQRGYSIVQKGSGEIVTSPADSSDGETLIVHAAGGQYEARRVTESAK